MIRGRRSRLLIMITALTTLTIAVALGWVLTRHEPAGRIPEHAVPLGAFLGSGQDGVEAVTGFESALGVEITVGHTYLPGRTWTDLEGPDAILDPWSAWRSADPHRMLVLNVPMLAPNEPPLGDAEAAVQLRAGADGAYDGHFRTLAQRLVGRNVADTIVVLGWEMNGTTYSSRCGPNPLAWKQYWQRIVTTMRRVPGAQFRFDFAPVRGSQAAAWPDCYPGDGVVDIIGMDSYDMPPGRDFSDYVHQPYGLQAQVDFAKARGKPVSYPEWGLFEAGDNAAYVRDMYTWISTHDVAYQTISDYCPHGVWECAGNPSSRAVYRQLFGVTRSSPPPGR